jgi:hypothetical protein
VGGIGGAGGRRTDGLGFFKVHAKEPVVIGLLHGNREERRRKGRIVFGIRRGPNGRRRVAGMRRSGLVPRNEGSGTRRGLSSAQSGATRRRRSLARGRGVGEDVVEVVDEIDGDL